MSMIVNRRDIEFVMYDVLGLDQLLQNNRYTDYDKSTIDAILDTAQEIAEEKYLPVAAKLDAQEPTYEGGKVHIIPEVREALDAFAEAGFYASGFDQDKGGMQLPGPVVLAASGMFVAANLGIASYSFLTIAASNMLNAFGDINQKSLFLPPMLEGRWFGTMCLSEPQAGSSLSDIRTKATPTEDGHFLITGNKMWISGGEHDLSENIVHMVLAKIPGGPPGVKGISLFIVPKYRVNADGSLGEKNNIALAGLNHKMGQRGTTNALLNFGESGPCHGWLVGEVHMGLAYMFHMMNEARIGVGCGAAMSGLAGYLYSLDYARNRPQGRHPQDKDPSSPQVMIIEHADVKRMLLAQKAYVEGAISLVFYCSFLVDRQKVSTDENETKRLNLLLDILTPIVKSWPSEFCLEANKLAIQVLGGYGYTREFPVERFYRDNRLNHIHEGTHAIQGLDLLGRKVAMQDGKALSVLLHEIEATISNADAIPNLSEFTHGLRNAARSLRKATRDALNADMNRGLANATVYLDAFGHVVVAWVWLKQAIVAHEALEASESEDAAFYEGKLAACRYFYRYELPKVFPAFELVSSLDDTCLEMRARQFVGV